MDQNENQNPPSEHELAAERVAQAFDAWQALERVASSNPLAVKPEQMAAAWSVLEQVAEMWRNSR